jgi:hypothetical protein
VSVRVPASQKTAAMRTLLRKIPTGLYFQGPDQWTGDPSAALNFKTIDRALKFIENLSLKEVELAFAFRDFNHVTCVPLERIETRYSQE